MSDQNDVNSGQQDNSGQQADNVDWKGRYQGASQKINELMTKIQELNAQLLQRSSEMEQLRAELSLRGQENTIALGARDQQLNELLTAKSSQDAELARLRALAKKTEIAIAMGKPELLAVAKHIPDLDNEEALKVVMTELAQFGEAQAKSREQQLLSGMGQIAGGQVGTAAATLSSPEAWRREIESKPLHSTERKKMLDDYGKWLNDTYGKQGA